MQAAATVAALQHLDPSGKEGSFEDLVALLLARLIGQPVRRARAGSQEGKDALSNDGALAIECKRYLASTPLSARHLIGELEEVKARHRDLQLWILATTTALGATEKEKLEQAAHSKGFAVLHLDTSATSPFLEATPAIAVLCATHIETTLKFLSGVARGRPSQRLRSELESIRSTPEFVPCVEWLRQEIRNQLPIWRFVTDRHNLDLVKRIRETAYTTFGTRYVEEISVRRQACAQLDGWFSRGLTVQSPELPPLAIVLGERYDGKTWLVYQWLVEIAKRSPIPIFFVGSARGIQSDRGLTELQILDLAPALKRERLYAESFVHNYRGLDAGKTPWALVVLDGLNEYAPNDGAWLRHLEAALGRGDSDCRPAMVLLTVRTRSWPELKDLLPRKNVSSDFAGLSGRVQDLATLEIPLGPFTEAELREALVRLELPADLLEVLPDNARELAHRPRYLEILARYRRDLRDYAAVTPEVLHWLDLCDKIGRMRQGRADWGPGQYQGFLRDLAKRWLDHKFLDEASVREILGTLTKQVPDVLAELRSEGILSGESGNYTIQPDRLALGYGLFLRDALVQAFRRGDSLKEALHDLLAPFGEGDEAVDALRAASTLMLIEVTAATAASRELTDVLDTLLWEWLNSRNLRVQDLEAIHALRRLLFAPLLRCYREIWNKTRRDSRMREIAVMVFGEEVEEGSSTTKDELRTAVRAWFRLVPLEGGWFQKERAKVELKAEGENDAAAAAAEEAVASLVQSRVGQHNLHHLELQIVQGLDVTSLQALGLYLLSRVPELVDPAGLLAFSVVRIVIEEPIGSGEFWVLRRAAANAPPQWFRREFSRCTKEPNGTLWQALRELIRITARADLSRIKEDLSLVEGDAEERSGSSRWPTKQNYKQLLRRSLKSPREAELFAKRVGKLLCDPSLPQPSEKQRLAFALMLKKSFSERSRAGNVDALQDFEEVLSTLAAWMSTFGAQLVGQFIRGLPSRLQKGQRTFLLELRGHAALARGYVREALQEALRLSRKRKDDWRVITQRELTLALLPAAGLETTVTLLTANEDKRTHKETFRLAGSLRNAADRPILVELIKSARSPLRKRRLRSLLAMAGGSPLPASEVQAICQTLRKGVPLDICAALELAVESKINIDPNLLFPISRREVAADTYAADYASRLLVEGYDHKRIKDHLGGYWRAKSAARRPEDAQAFLDEISASLSEYKERRGGIDHSWEKYDLPKEILPHLTRERIAEWTRAFDSWGGAGWRFFGGLVRPTFDWCLHHGMNEPARTLWSQVYPFHRRRFGGGSSLTIDGVDWVLHALSRPENDDDLTRSFLTELILDARTDLELLEIALGGYFRGGLRLRELAHGLSTDSQADKRARAVAILGWLVEDKEHLEILSKEDPSLWVREQAEIALKRHASESWSKRWFEQFLTARAIVDRWAAGQLFLTCADRRIDAWAWKRLREGKIASRPKGESNLLLWAAQERAMKEAEELKSSFLGYTVNELSTVAHPWRRDDEWILHRYGRRD